MTVGGVTAQGKTGPAEGPAGSAVPGPTEAGEELIHLSSDNLERLAQGAGKAGKVVNLWATWCGPCREELPMLAKVHQRYVARGISVVPVSVDEPDSESKIIPMLKSYGFSGPYYVASRPLDSLKAKLGGAWPGNIPVSFLLDGSGRVRFFWTAEVYEEELVPKLDSFLAGKLSETRADFKVAPGKTL